MAVVKWLFEDPVTLLSETFEINPNSGGTPEYTRNFTYLNTAAPGGKALALQGGDQPGRGTFSGTLLTQSQLDMFVEWWTKGYQIRLTDDLNREFTILIESFKATRQRSFQYPYKHTYEVSYVILDWPS